MTKSILVTGESGQLGQSLQKIAINYLQYSFTFVGREELDLSQPQSIEGYFEDKCFDVIINCAAYTAVDKAESEPDLADQINHLAVKQLAEIAKDKNIMLIHISTDYVFNGESYKPYIETDSTDPKNIYGLTKLKGEQAIKKINLRAIIIRTSWVYSEFGKNFSKTILRLSQERSLLNVIFDQVGTPTYAGDLAKALLDIIKHPNFNELNVSSNIYHYSNEGVTSWYDFSKAIISISGIDCQVNPIETVDYPTPTVRPYYSLLNKQKIKKYFEIEIPFWSDSLKDCLSGIQLSSVLDK